MKKTFRHSLLGYALLGVGLILLVLTRAPELSAINAILGSLILLAGVIPAIHYFQIAPTDRSTIPLLPLAGVFYGLFFGASVFVVRLLWVPDEGRYIHYNPKTTLAVSTEAQFLVLAGIGLMYAGYYFFRANMSRHSPQFRLPKIQDDRWTDIVVGGLVIAQLIYFYIPSVQQLPSVGQFVVPAGYLAFGYFYVRWRKKQLKPFVAVPVLLIAFPLVIIKLITSGYLSPLILTGLLFVVLEMAIGGRIRWLPLLMLPIILLLAYPPMMVIRTYIWDSSKNLNTAEKLSYSAKFFLDYYVLEGVEENLHRPGTGKLSFSKNPINYRGLAIRTSHIVLLANVMDASPKRVPYWRGETYVPLFTHFIPRVIWPEKPQERTGNAFGQRYGFLDNTDYKMSLNLPWITEMYANFGTIGVFCGMTLVGILLAFLETAFCRPKVPALQLVAGAVVVLPFFYQESNFSLVAGSFIPLVVCIWIYFYVAARVPFERLLDAIHRR
ncbi:MAG: hypothetical protein HN572_13010 [Kordiimonadaceae bacterium]|nr:hypothetical protein [Kordiimonadaceae bacterium]